MGYRLMNECRPLRFGRDATKPVLMMLARHMDDDTRRGWPGLALLADEVGRSPDTVRRALRFLEALGILQRLSLPTGRGNRVHWVLTRASAWPSAEDIALAIKQRCAERPGRSRGDGR